MIARLVDQEPMVAYRFEDSRGGRCVARHLSGFNGILQVDGHGAYTSMVKEQAKSGSNETFTLVRCWAHVRRKFYELHVGGINDAATASVKAIEIDSNIVERAIRPQTITRKNSLFAGSEGGGNTWATIATLLQTCK
jgi:hypothetical protein